MIAILVLQGLTTRGVDDVKMSGKPCPHTLRQADVKVRANRDGEIQMGDME